MRRYRTYWLLVSVGVGAGVIPAAIASRNGTEAAYNGGIAAFGQGCAACHPFNIGPGKVELLGLPQRYRSGKVYDLSVRISDPQQAGAGFEISAEVAFGDHHVGTFLQTDLVNTDFASGDPAYLTHTRDGVDDSIADWSANGGAYEYHMAWQAPQGDVGDITFFAAGNAINDATSFAGDRYYAADATILWAAPGDADGDAAATGAEDTDVDLYDYVTFQNCFGATPAPPGCEYVDMDDDAVITLDDLPPWIAERTGPNATVPAEYVLADAVRGGKLYDRWWTVGGVPEPTGDHPLYPPAGAQAGSITFRCKECHGWDYKGKDGVYATGPHYTGIARVANTELSPRAIFELLKADPAVTPNGHNMDAYGMTDRDLWDVTKMVLEGVIDTDGYISDGAFNGDSSNGNLLYSPTCAQCHGEDGKYLNFSPIPPPEYVGTVAVDNPWEFLHKVRFGHPGSSMPATDLLRWALPDAADVGAYSQTLPTE